MEDRTIEPPPFFTALHRMDVTLVVAVLVILSLGLWARKKSSRLPLPPIYVSSTDERPSEKPYQRYARCLQKLGPIFTVRASGRPIIVLNTVEAATDLLERRSNFACRPYWPMIELLGRHKNVGFQPYGESLKRGRRLLHGSLGATVVMKDWGHLLDEQSVRLLRKFLSSPEAFYSNVQESIEELLMKFTYGYQPSAEQLQLAKKAMGETGAALQPGKWRVDSMPALRYVPSFLPGAGFKRWAESARIRYERLTGDSFYRVKSDMLKGCAEVSFVRRAIEASGNTAEEETVIISAAGGLDSAGIATLSGWILNAILLLIRHPKVQERAYAEIVAAVGIDRLPGASDKNLLPYVDCVIQEIHRFNPAAPLVHHGNIQEDHYLGYRIPRKSWIMANVWAMLHDADVYPQPDKFIPERFMRSNERQDVPRDPRTLAYGFGRRSCPGSHFANNFLYLVVVRILSTFELLPANVNGTPEMPPLDFITALVPAPKPFKCIIQPRPRAEEFLHHEQLSA